MHTQHCPPREELEDSCDWRAAAEVETAPATRSMLANEGSALGCTAATRGTQQEQEAAKERNRNNQASAKHVGAALGKACADRTAATERQQAQKRSSSPKTQTQNGDRMFHHHVWNECLERHSILRFLSRMFDIFGRDECSRIFLNFAEN